MKFMFIIWIVLPIQIKKVKSHRGSQKILQSGLRFDKTKVFDLLFEKKLGYDFDFDCSSQLQLLFVDFDFGFNFSLRLRFCIYVCFDFGFWPRLRLHFCTLTLASFFSKLTLKSFLRTTFPLRSPTDEGVQTFLPDNWSQKLRKLGNLQMSLHYSFFKSIRAYRKLWVFCGMGEDLDFKSSASKCFYTLVYDVMRVESDLLVICKDAHSSLL